MKLFRFVLPTLLYVAGLLLGASAAHADELAEVQRLRATGQTAAALERADKFLADKPKDPQMRFTKGVLLSDAQRNDEAIEVFRRLSEDYPELPEPYNNLAALYASAGNYDAAKTALDQALRANPRFAAAYENLGDVLAMMALRAYREAQQLESDNPSLPAKLKLVQQLLKPTPSAPPAKPVK